MIFQVMLAVALFGHSQAAEETVGRPTISLDLDAMTTPPRAYTTSKAGVPCWCADVSCVWPYIDGPTTAHGLAPLAPVSCVITSPPLAAYQE